LKTLTQNFIAVSAVVLSSCSAESAHLDTGLHHQIGLQGSHHRYGENAAKQLFSASRTGNMIGVYYNAEFRPESMPYAFAAEGRAAMSNMIRYKSKVFGNAKKQRNRDLELRLTAAYLFPSESQWTVAGYSGIGAKYFFTIPNDQYPTTKGKYQYYKRSEYNYIPLGIRFEGELSNEKICVVHLEYDHLIKAQQKNRVGIYSNKQKQPHGYGARAGADFVIPSDKYDLSYVIGVFARYWDMKDSKADKGFYQPKNSNQEYGIKLGLSF
jgi:hypothetical protein